MTDEKPENSHPASKQRMPDLPTWSPAVLSFIIHGHLALWSIFGVLARLGLGALTEYPNAPVSFGVLWANVAGSAMMGFLLEERMLFVETARRKVFDVEFENGEVDSRRRAQQEEVDVREEATEPLAEGEATGEGGTGDVRVRASLMSESEGRLAFAAYPELAQADYVKAKKTLPLYIGLATGFCGSFTSFSTYILDTFLAASNDLVLDQTVPRAAGDSFMAFAAVACLNPAMGLAGFYFGGHLARAAAVGGLSVGMHGLPHRWLPTLDVLMTFLGYGCWIGGIFMTAFPPLGHNAWRGKPLFALVFGPLGTMLRYHLAGFNAGRSYPIGTLAANLLGSAMLGAFFVGEHVPVRNVVSCQVLAGLSDGFCGCLTTVSTWVAELAGMETARAYRYGVGSFTGGFLLMLPIVGGLRWAKGFAEPVC